MANQDNSGAPQAAPGRQLWLASAGAAAIAIVLLVIAILPAEYGVDPLGTGDTGGYSNLLSRIGETPTCGPDDDDIDAPIPAPSLATAVDDRAGTILYFRHEGGGHVLVIGASATPWALDSDATLSGLLQRGLACFAYDQGCGRELFLPAILKLP